VWKGKKKSKGKPAPEPLTLQQAIEAGLVEIPHVHIPGVKVVDHVAREERYYPTWRDFRNNLRAIYYGGTGHLGFRDAPSGIRETALDIGPYAPAVNHRVARGAAIDSGVAEVVASTELLIELRDRAKRRRNKEALRDFRDMDDN